MRLQTLINWLLYIFIKFLRSSYKLIISSQLYTSKDIDKPYIDRNTHRHWWRLLIKYDALFNWSYIITLNDCLYNTYFNIWFLLSITLISCVAMLKPCCKNSLIFWHQALLLMRYFHLYLLIFYLIQAHSVVCPSSPSRPSTVRPKVSLDASSWSFLSPIELNIQVILIRPALITKKKI